MGEQRPNHGEREMSHGKMWKDSVLLGKQTASAQASAGRLVRPIGLPGYGQQLQFYFECDWKEAAGGF